MRFYEIATLKTVIFGTGKAAPAVEAWVKAGKGRLLGAFGLDIGALNEVNVFRGFESLDELWQERDRALKERQPLRMHGVSGRPHVRHLSAAGFPPARGGGEFRAASTSCARTG